jgi:hypothetical protein
MVAATDVGTENAPTVAGSLLIILLPPLYI